MPGANPPGLTDCCGRGITLNDMKTTLLAPTSLDIGRVPTFRKGCLLLTVATVVLLFAFGASLWSEPVRATIRWAGLGLILACIGGRTWCILYIGGRKSRELVTTGPYSISRNPLYLFSIIGAVGVGAQAGALSVALLAGVLVAAIHGAAAAHEERCLLVEHGDTYRRYLAAVPRFLPRLTRWKNAEFLQVRPRAVARTFFDACFFLAAVPLAALFAHLHSVGIMPAVLTLP